MQDDDSAVAELVQKYSYSVVLGKAANIFNHFQCSMGLFVFRSLVKIMFEVFH